jgi:hypothetical protein
MTREEEARAKPGSPNPYFVIPAQAGIQTASVPATAAAWIPAFAGMTKE